MTINKVKKRNKKTNKFLFPRIEIKHYATCLFWIALKPCSDKEK